MNQVSRLAGRAVSLSLAIYMVFGFILPGTSAAVGSTRATSAFCSKVLPARQNQFEKSVSNLKDRVTTAWQNQDTRLKALASGVDSKVAADRKAADAERQSDYAKLEAKATTDAQKSAVQTYEAAVNSAVTTKRNADNAAVATFRAGVKAAIDARRTTVLSQATNFKESVDGAFAAASFSCQAGVGSASTIRTTLIDTLRTARTNFVADRHTDDKLGAQVKALAANRNATFKANQATFKASMQAAASALKTAFGSDSSNV